MHLLGSQLGSLQVNLVFSLLDSLQVNLQLSHLVNLPVDLHHDVHLAITLNTALVDWLLIPQCAAVCNVKLVNTTLSLEVCQTLHANNVSEGSIAVV